MQGAPAKEGEVFEEEFTDDDEAAPFGEHPDNPNYYEEERRAMPSVIYCGWGAVILVYWLTRRWTPSGSVHVSRWRETAMCLRRLIVLRPILTWGGQEQLKSYFRGLVPAPLNLFLLGRYGVKKSFLSVRHSR